MSIMLGHRGLLAKTSQAFSGPNCLSFEAQELCPVLCYRADHRPISIPSWAPLPGGLNSHFLSSGGLRRASDLREGRHLLYQRDCELGHGLWGEARGLYPSDQLPQMDQSHHSLRGDFLKCPVKARDNYSQRTPDEAR